MKVTIKSNIGMSALRDLKPILLAAMCGLLAMAGTVRADGVNPRIAPPNSLPHGRSYAEWSAALMQWMFSLPTTHHPVFDTADLSAGQTDHVWFLAGNFTGAPVTRNAIIPQGTALFIDLLNYWADDTDCPHPDSFTVAQLRALAKAAMDPAFGLHCTIDGVPVTGLSDPSHTAYRAQAPVFTYTVPPVNNLLNYFGLACYTDTSPNPSPIFVNANAITDGYYVFL